MMTKHVITALVDNQPGVLARIVSLISGRGFNIESLNVAPTINPRMSRMTVTVPGDDRGLEQVAKQLDRLINVLSVADLTGRDYVGRELAFVDVSARETDKAAIKRIAAVFDAKVVAVRPGTLTIQMVGEMDSIDELIETLKQYHVLDVYRSGVVAVARGGRSK
jgi:acetolactate synthase-1/3 small subunit